MVNYGVLPFELWKKIRTLRPEKKLEQDLLFDCNRWTVAREMRFRALFLSKRLTK